MNCGKSSHHRMPKKDVSCFTVNKFRMNQRSDGCCCVIDIGEINKQRDIEGTGDYKKEGIWEVIERAGNEETEPLHSRPV